MGSRDKLQRICGTGLLRLLTSIIGLAWFVVKAFQAQGEEHPPLVITEKGNALGLPWLHFAL